MWWRAVHPGSVTNTVLRRASVPVLVWAGLERMSSGRFWQDARCSQKWKSDQEVARQGKYAAATGWPAQLGGPADDDRPMVCRGTQSAKRRSIERFDDPH
jgi:hypothetical protein